MDKIKGLIDAPFTPVSYTHLDVYKRQYHLYEGGVQAVLGQHQGGRTGYRDGALAGTGAGVLLDGGREERQET